MDGVFVGGASYDATEKAFVFDGSYDGGLSGSSSTAYKLYVNGVSIAGPTGGTSAATLNLNANAILAIGADHFGAGALFNGKISNFKLYDTALTAEEVKTLYDMGRCDEGHHVVNFSKTRVGIGLGDGEAPMGDMHVRGPVVLGPGTLPEDYWFQPALTIFETFRASTSARPGGGIQFCQYDSPGQGWMKFHWSTQNLHQRCSFLTS
jgi:hypothetical protein